MAKTSRHGFNDHIDNLLDYPGCDSKTLMLRKTSWIMSLISLGAVISLTVGFLIFAPSLTLLITYGIILTGVSLLYLLPVPFIRGTTMKLNFVAHLGFILITFVFILLLGGIPTSAGLIFVGLSAVLFSIPYQNRMYSMTVFGVYFLTVLAAGLLQPWLKVPPQMTPRINSVIYMINALWMSALVLSIIISFIRQTVRLEQLETKKIKEINDAKSHLYTNITHEFRTPLTIILGMSELILIPDWRALELELMIT